MSDDILTFIGLIRKAGKLIVGEENVRNACRSKSAELILLADDASNNALDRAEKAAGFVDRPLVRLHYTKNDISQLTGLPGCSMAAVTDLGFAVALLEKLIEAKSDLNEDTLRHMKMLQSASKQSKFRRK